MKAMCHREGLLSACQLASAALPSRDVKPILKNFKAIAEDGRCTLIATDLEVAIRMDIQGLTIEEPGEAILPASKLIAILRESRDDSLSIEANSDSCIVKGRSLFFEMASEDPAQFPEWPSFTEEKHHEMTAGTLREMIRRTVFAASDEATRYSMSGVLWELIEDKVRLVATDGRRLALTDGLATAQGGHTTEGLAPIVPRKAMSLVERNLQDDADQLVQVAIRPNDALFRTETAVLYTRLVEARFPDYNRVIPDKHAVRVPLQAAEFLTAVRQAAIMVDDETRRLEFEFTPGKLVLQAEGAQTGKSQVDMAIDFNESTPIKIFFNPNFLIEMLRVLPPDADLELELIDGNTAALFRSGDKYLYLVMPLT